MYNHFQLALHYRTFSLLFYNLCLFFSLVVFLLACMLPLSQYWWEDEDKDWTCPFASFKSTAVLWHRQYRWNFYDTQLKIWNRFFLKCWELNPDFIEGLEGPCYRAFCLAYINFKSRLIFDNKENNHPGDMSYTYFSSDALRLLTIYDHRYIIDNHS